MEFNDVINGIDFEAKSVQTYYRDEITNEFRVSPGRQTIVRADNYDYLGDVGSHYKIQSHKENLKLVYDSISKYYNQKDLTVKNRIEKARIYTHFEVNSDIILSNVKNETARVGIDVLNSYDATRSLSIIISIWRLICTNGAYGFANEYQLKKMHTKGLSLGPQVLNNIGDAVEYYKKSYVELYKKLANIKPLSEDRINESTLPKKIVKSAVEIYAKEKTENAWLQYNAFTNAITHGEIQQTTRLQYHQTLVNLFLANVASK